MRGAPARSSATGRRSRIIPAYAGSTTADPSTPADDKDHPRICGEHHVRLAVHQPAPGSSPHMRGALGYSADDAAKSGIIPAYAGSTATRRYCAAPPRDHPRICGEHLDVGKADLGNDGSSPHMRGARWVRNIMRMKTGIIPAYAGSTHEDEDSYIIVKDHPRICGEHLHA